MTQSDGPGDASRRPLEPWPKRWAKTVFYWLCLNAGPVWVRNAWLRVRGRTRYTVLLYHRVNDVSRDVLTTSTERFAEHLATITCRYPLLSLSAAVANAREGRYRGPNVVVITFDDGYADNHDHAARILERFRAPATFFVTVGFVDTSRVFAHDRTCPHRFANLTGAQVRSLAARGFEVGSHGMTHANLAQCSLDQARSEIRDSRSTLERLVGVPVRSFAYPFGGRSDITPTVRAEIHAAGYGVIASAYGGVNVDRVTPSNVLRIGVGQSFDALTLRAQIEGVSLQSIRQRVLERIQRRTWNDTGARARFGVQSSGPKGGDRSR